MASLAVNPGANDLGNPPLRAQMKLMGEVEQYGARLIVVWKTTHLGQLVLGHRGMADGAECLVLRLGFEPLRVATGATVVTRSRYRCIRLAGLMTIDALRSRLQMPAVAKDEGLLRLRLCSGYTGDDPR